MDTDAAMPVQLPRPNSLAIAQFCLLPGILLPRLGELGITWGTRWPRDGTDMAADHLDTALW